MERLNQDGFSRKLSRKPSWKYHNESYNVLKIKTHLMPGLKVTLFKS